MKTEIIVNQIVRLINGFPNVASTLNDLNNQDTGRRLSRCLDTLTSHDILHVGRFERQNIPVDLNKEENNKQSKLKNELKRLEENLMSLVAFLIERPDAQLLSEVMEGTEKIEAYPEKGALPQNHLLTELESLFMTLYKMLRAFDNNPSTLQTVISTTNHPTLLLFVKAAQMSDNGLGATGRDIPHNAYSYHQLYRSIVRSPYTPGQWNQLTMLMLATLGHVTIANTGDWVETKSTDNFLYEYAARGDQRELTAITQKNPSTGKIDPVTSAILFSNFPQILYRAAEHQHFDVLLYLLNLYETEIKKEDRKWEDLQTAPTDFSVLAKTLYFGHKRSISKLHDLQGGYRFNKMDREMVIGMSDDEWKNKTTVETYKPLIGRTLLHLAARINNPALIESLVEQTGINLNEKTYYTGITALELAEMRGQHLSVGTLKKLEKMKNK